MTRQLTLSSTSQRRFATWTPKKPAEHKPVLCHSSSLNTNVQPSPKKSASWSFRAQNKWTSLWWPNGASIQMLRSFLVKLMKNLKQLPLLWQTADPLPNHQLQDMDHLHPLLQLQFLPNQTLDLSQLQFHLTTTLHHLQLQPHPDTDHQLPLLLLHQAMEQFQPLSPLQPQSMSPLVFTVHQLQDPFQPMRRSSLAMDPVSLKSLSFRVTDVVSDLLSLKVHSQQLLMATWTTESRFIRLTFTKHISEELQKLLPVETRWESLSAQFWMQSWCNFFCWHSCYLFITYDISKVGIIYAQYIDFFPSNDCLV